MTSIEELRGRRPERNKINKNQQFAIIPPVAGVVGGLASTGGAVFFLHSALACSISFSLWAYSRSAAACLAAWFNDDWW